MKESVTKFDLEAAFKALDEIDVPKAAKVKANRPALTEIFSRKSKFDALMEEYYDISNMSELDDAKEAREAEVAQAKLARIEKIVDLDAESPEDLLPSYVGKFIMQCPQCMTLFYKDPEDVEASEEDPSTVNVNEVCQHCGNESGYTLIGKVGEATQEEQAEAVGEQEVDVDSTEEGEESLELTDETPEEPADENLDLELDELDLDLEDDAEVEEQFHAGNSGTVLTEVMQLREGAGADTKNIASSILNKLAEEDKNSWAKTTAEILDVIPDDAIDDIVDELGKKFQDFSLSVAEQKEIEAASEGTIQAADKPDTLGKILDAIDPFEQAKKSPKLIKATVSTILTIIGVLEPTPIIELVASVVSTLPAEVIMAVLSLFNPVGLVAAGVNKLYKANKAKAASNSETANTVPADDLTEDADVDISADEFESLIKSPEFKKPVSDQEARAMMDELSDEKAETNESLNEVYKEDAVYESIYDVFNSGAFISRPGFDRQFTAKRINDNEYKVTHIKTNTSAVVRFNVANEADPTLRFTINGKSFNTMSTSEAQGLIAKELTAVRSKQFDLALDESVKVNGENLKYVVLNPDGTYAGAACTSYEEARELAAQKEGRVIVELGELVDYLTEGVFDKLKDKFSSAVSKLKSRDAKADWLLANTPNNYDEAELLSNGNVRTADDNKRFKTFIVIGYSSRDNKGALIKTAPEFNDRNLVLGKNGVQLVGTYKEADKIAKAWSEKTGNGPAFIYLALDENDDNAAFICEYFMGNLEKDQVDKYFNEINAELRNVESTQSNAAAEETNTNESLESVMANVDELQEGALENLISNSLVESYGNVAGFRLTECAYENNKLSVNGTIFFTSGNKRNTSYVFSDAEIAGSKISLRGLNEKLGLNKQFTIAGYVDNTKTFITEAFHTTKK